MYLWCHKQETQENKNLLHKMMQKWILRLTNSNISWDEYRAEQSQNSHRREVIERNLILNHQLKPLKIQQVTTKRARLPERPGFDFVTIPQSNIEEREDNSNNNNRRKNDKLNGINERFRNLRQQRSSNRTIKPSITGK